MGLHDTATVAGVTEACRYNDHSICNHPSCGCDCHKKVNLVPPMDDTAKEAGPEKACPKCGTKRPATDTFCRIDGERLTSLACGMCGRGMNPEDAFCFNCGGPKGTVGVVKLPQTVTVPQVEVDSEKYEQQVLKGLQEELSGQPEVVDDVQKVVEQPGGSQGSFKIVSAPNPNKVRVPRPAGSQIRPSIKLPIKPS